MTDRAEPLVITGGEALARMVIAFDGGPIFGMGGFQLLPFYDAARRLGIAHYLINDERAGVFAADAFAKLSGRVGLVDATLGPGATNLITGLVEALNAGTPLVALVGETHQAHSGKNMTQESRQVEMLRPAVKELITITSTARIPELMRRAFAVATVGRPGPVVVNIPEDVCHSEHTYDPREFHANPIYRRVPALRTRPDKESAVRAAELIAAARRPIILAGGGVHLSGAHEQLARFADTLCLPVAHTLTGKGSIACINPLSAGLFGRYDRFANRFIQEADLILVIGCKLGEIATKRYTLPRAGARIVQIDIVAEEFGRTVDVEVALWGDVREALVTLTELLASRAVAIAERQSGYAAEVSEAMTTWREALAASPNLNERPISMTRLLAELNSCLPADAVLVADGGFAAHWSGLLFDTKQPGRGFLPDRGFASIGYGVPGAIGASLAAPGRPVVSLTGDGGLNMMLGELETARRLGVNATIVVVNNAASGYVKALQHQMYGPNAYNASDFVEMNYAAIAESMGCGGIRVDDPEKLGQALTFAIESEGLTVVDVVVTRDPAKMLPGVDSRTADLVHGVGGR